MITGWTIEKVSKDSHLNMITVSMTLEKQILSIFMVIYLPLILMNILNQGKESQIFEFSLKATKDSTCIYIWWLHNCCSSLQQELHWIVTPILPQPRSTWRPRTGTRWWSTWTSPACWPSPPSTWRWPPACPAPPPPSPWRYFSSTTYIYISM